MYNIGKVVVTDTGKRLQDVHIAEEDTTALIEELAKSSTQQAKSIAATNQSMNQIASVVQSNAAIAEESAAAAQQMSAQAITLHGSISQFKLGQTNI